MSVSHSIREAVGIVNAARSIASVVAVVSESRRRPGVAAVTYELAMGLARSRRQVAIVDCDLSVPLLHERLLRPVAPGFTEVLSGGRLIDDVIEYEPVDIGQLMTVTAGADGPSHAGLFDSDEAFEAIDRLRELNELVVLLGGPLDSPGGQEVARLADAVVLVVDDVHEADAEVRPSLMAGVHAFVIAWTVDPTSGLSDLLDLEYGVADEPAAGDEDEVSSVDEDGVHNIDEAPAWGAAIEAAAEPDPVAAADVWPLDDAVPVESDMVAAADVWPIDDAVPTEEAVPRHQGAVAFAARVRGLTASRLERPPADRSEADEQPAVDVVRSPVEELLSAGEVPTPPRLAEPRVFPTEEPDSGNGLPAPELVDAWMAQYDFSDVELDAAPSEDDNTPLRRKRSLLGRRRSTRYID